MAKLGLERHIVDQEVYENTLKRFKEAGIILPTFAELADPQLIPEKIKQSLELIDPDAPDPLNLFRVHWYNDAERRGLLETPAYISLPSELTGTEAQIVLALGDHFPLIHTHKVLAAYACLVPRLITGQFDPTQHKAIWPSTGNYCRGGVAISRILQCRGVGILPEGMSQERFSWLQNWVEKIEEDIIATPGSESNVKEIYDKCNELDLEEENIIFNQFSEFGNHLAHYACTGRALARIYEQLREEQPELRLRAYISATGSGGTIAAGDYLKDAFGSDTVALEALECPTLLYNGFGEHNIQGIGDKHLPLIHNVMETDMVVAISDLDTDSLFVLFNTEAGQEYLRERRGISQAVIESLSHMGLSSICNLLGAIKYAKYHKLGAQDLVISVATDGAAMYYTEREKALERYWGGRFDTVSAAEVFGRSLLGLGVDHLSELSRVEKERIFNLGYFTWVEQQGISLEEFEARRRPGFWKDLRDLLRAWDEMISAFNAQVGL